MTNALARSSGTTRNASQSEKLRKEERQVRILTCAFGPFLQSTHTHTTLSFFLLILWKVPAPHYQYLGRETQCSKNFFLKIIRYSLDNFFQLFLELLDNDVTSDKYTLWLLKLPNFGPSLGSTHLYLDDLTKKIRCQLK